MLTRCNARAATGVCAMLTLLCAALAVFISLARPDFAAAPFSSLVFAGSGGTGGGGGESSEEAASESDPIAPVTSAPPTPTTATSKKQQKTETSESPPNVLLLISDDFKPILGCYGNERGRKMVNLDKLASESVVFRNAHAQMSICGPSRASFLTSLRPDTLGIYYVYPNLLWKYVHMTRTTPGKKEALLLPKLFKLAGYATYGVAKQLHENENVLLSDSSIWSSPTYNIRKLGGRPKAFTSPYQGRWIQNPDVPDTFFPDGQAANLSAHLLLTELNHPDSAKDTSPQPWFMAVGLWKPHIPWSAPKKYFDMAGSPSDYAPSHHHAAIEGLSEDQMQLVLGSGCSESHAYSSYTLDKRRAADDVLSKASHAYHATALYMDAQMGIILDALDKSSARDNTIVVFLGDHGFHLGDHGLYCKHTNFEQGTKVPFMIKPPRRDTHWQRGAQSFAPVELLDLMPTLYDLAGLTLDRSKYQSWEGTSLMPILRDPDSAWVKFGAMSQFAHKRGGKLEMGYTLRTTRYRFTAWGQHAHSQLHEFYDYLEDPWETRIVKNESAKKRLLMSALRAARLGDKAAALTEPFDFAAERQAMRDAPVSQDT